MLSDPDKRKQYDTFGQTFRPGQAPGDGFQGGFDFRDAAGFDLGDLFGGLFNRGAGGRPREQRPPRGSDVEVQVRVSFADALRGVTLKVPVVKANACDACHGTGAAPGTSPTICPDCKGRGVTSDSQGLFSLSHTCRRCGGAGTVIENACGVCGGSGRVRSTSTYKVRIPPASATAPASRCGARARRLPGAAIPATCTWSRRWMRARSSNGAATT